MNGLELESYCIRHPHCDYNCVRCPGFVRYQRNMDNREEDDFETFSLKQEIMETSCDDIGF